MLAQQSNLSWSPNASLRIARSMRDTNIGAGVWPASCYRDDVIQCEVHSAYGLPTDLTDAPVSLIDSKGVNFFGGGGIATTGLITPELLASLHSMGSEPGSPPFVSLGLVADIRLVTQSVNVVAVQRILPTFCPLGTSPLATGLALRFRQRLAVSTGLMNRHAARSLNWLAAALTEALRAAGSSLALIARVVTALAKVSATPPRERSSAGTEGPNALMAGRPISRAMVAPAIVVPTTPAVTIMKLAASLNRAVLDRISGHSEPPIPGVTGRAIHVAPPSYFTAMARSPEC